MKIKNVKVYGLEESIKASGYPMKTDEPEEFILDSNDYARAKNLSNTPKSSGHSNFRKGILISFDIKYPQYWSLQFQRYNFAEIVSSQSKMHKLMSIKNVKTQCNRFVLQNVMLDRINWLIEVYNKGGFDEEIIVDNILIKNKLDLFYTIISSLPMGYEMWMRVTTNYEQLSTIYYQRKNHKLKHDWGYFCNWIKTLPMAKELITRGNV